MLNAGWNVTWCSVSLKLTRKNNIFPRNAQDCPFLESQSVCCFRKINLSSLHSYVGHMSEKLLTYKKLSEKTTYVCLLFVLFKHWLNINITQYFRQKLYYWVGQTNSFQILKLSLSMTHRTMKNWGIFAAEHEAFFHLKVRHFEISGNRVMDQRVAEQ